MFVKSKLALWLIPAFFLIAMLWPTNYHSELDLETLARIPVQHEGRVKALDTVARSNLLAIHGKESITSDKGKISAIAWLAEFCNSPAAAYHPLFRVDALDLVFEGKPNNTPYATPLQLQSQLDQIEKVGRSLELQDRSQLDAKSLAYLQVWEQYLMAFRLRNSFFIENPEIPASGSKGKTQKELFTDLLAWQDEVSPFQPIPPSATAANQEWMSTGGAMLRDPKNPAPLPWILLKDSIQNGNLQEANKHLKVLDQALTTEAPQARASAAFEAYVNEMDPFFWTQTAYLLAFLAVAASWIWIPKRLLAVAWVLLLTGFALHTFGLLARMLIEGRPPVTNLHSSALFVGWGVIALALLIERSARQGYATCVAALVGWLCLNVASTLASDGDTMEVMRAVLNSNFWLSTHVVTITIGYSATFLAGALACYAILKKAIARDFPKQERQSLHLSVYGMLCFATLFSFVGTVLGGVWADQSWGRFWGWDPKENGALLIILWNAIILHVRWGGFLRGDRPMVLPVFGNIVTAFAWFGVNLLGVGLHSYGFTDKGAVALGGFILSQVIIMIIGSWTKCGLPP